MDNKMLNKEEPVMVLKYGVTGVALLVFIYSLR